MNTNKFPSTTKEGFTIWQKTEDNQIFHFVLRDEIISYLGEMGAAVSVEKFGIKDGLAVVKVTIGYDNDFYQGVGSCRIANPNTDDHLGLAFKRAVANAAQTMGIGSRLEDGTSLSSLNRGVTPDEVLADAMNGVL